MSKQDYSYSLIFFVVLFTTQIHCIDNNELNAGLDTVRQYATPTAIENFKNVTKEKCLKATGSDAAFEAIERSVDELKNCTSGLIDFDVVQKEIEEAKPNGELDTVFNKYCRKRDVATACVENFTTKLNPCLEPEEIETKQIVLDIVKNILKFVCHRDGDQIALFIAEKGPECFDRSKDDLIGCKNSLVNTYFPSRNESLIMPTELPKFVIGDKQCQAMDSLKTCAVAALEKCEETTPANLVESLFNFIRKGTPCANSARKH